MNNTTQPNYRPEPVKAAFGHVFASFTNMALHNAYNIMCNITERLQIEDGAMRDDLGLKHSAALRTLAPAEKRDGNSDVFDVFIHPKAVFSDGRVLVELPLKKPGKPKNAPSSTPEYPFRDLQIKEIHHFVPPELQGLAARRLQHHFRFLEGEEDLKVMGSFLQKAFAGLAEERNFFTHYLYKKRRKLNLDFSDLIHKAKEKVLKSIESGLKPGNDPYRGFTKEKLTQQFNSEERALKELRLFEVAFATTDGQLTNFGLAFFMCLFLEKKYAVQFLSKIKITEGLDSVRKRFLEEWFWQFCVRMPRPKLESGELMLDMLNELGRCPEALYDRLSEADKQRFQIPAEVADERGIAQDTEVKFIRHGDRFPYFALSYFDEEGVFDRLRFQVHLGKYLKRKYNKEDFGERKIYQNLRTFGRRPFYLNVENNAPEDWRKPNAAEDGFWHIDEIEQFGPRYQITGNRIAFKIFSEKQTEEKWHALADYNADEVTRKSLFDPTGILSIKDLPNLLFYQYLYEKEREKENPALTKNAEDFLEDYIAEFHAFCKNVKDGKIRPVKYGFQKRSLFPNQKKVKYDGTGYNENEWNDLKRRKEDLQKKIDKHHTQIRVKNLPDALREYLLGYKRDGDVYKLKRKLKTRKSETERKIRDLENEAERMAKILEISGIEKTKLLAEVERKLMGMRKPPFGLKWRIQNGEISNWLVRDMIFLKPVQPELKNDGMPNGQETARLQEMIAYFSMHKSDIKVQFKDLGFTGQKESAHPFLYKTNFGSKDSVRGFYEVYLRKKLQWTEELIEDLERTKKIDESKFAGFIKSEKKSAKDKDYSSVPTFIPRCVFNEKIAEVLKKNGFEVKTEKGIGIVPCLEEYFSEKRQKMYDLIRIYEDGRASEKLELNGRGDWKMLKKDIDEAVENLEDARKNAPNNELPEPDFKRLKGLKNIRKTAMSNEAQLRFTLMTDRALMLAVREICAKKEAFDLSEKDLDLAAIDTPLTDDNLLNRPIPMKITVGNYTVTDNLPIRRWGDFRRFFKDKRVKQLVAYFPENQLISRDILIEELDSYDRMRPEFFAAVLDFERRFYEAFPDKLEAEMNKGKSKKNSLNHRTQLGLLKRWNQKSFDLIESLADDFKLSDSIDEKIEWLLSFRNKFSHNEVPLTNKLKSKIKFPYSKNENGETVLKGRMICERILDLAIENYGNLGALLI